MAILLALGSAVVYGAADFCGGLASRRSTAFAVVAGSQAAGLTALLLVLPLLGGRPTTADLVWGAAAGMTGAAALVLFYGALARGVMSVVAPVTAVSAAAVPVLAGAALGQPIGALALVGIALALVAVVLISAEDGLSSLRAARPAALVLPLVAGMGFGFFFVLLDRTREESMLSPLVSARVASITVVVAVALLAGRSLRMERPIWPLVLLAGVGDIAANSLFLIATQMGEQLALTGVLASLYPASTVLLAQMVLRERLAATQAVGLAAAAVAVALITLGG